MRISLKPNEKIFINGAVIRVDKKVTVELLNDATFLLASHVLQADETDTPLKQLYYAAQMILMNPQNKEHNIAIFNDMLRRSSQAFSDIDILDGLRECAFLASEERFFEILKIVRSLYGQEEQLLAPVKLAKAAR